MNAPLLPWRPMSAATTVTEQLFETNAAVEGRVPEWLTGTLMRTAPAIFATSAWRADHWFDGLGMMFSFGFEAGRVGVVERRLERVLARSAGAGEVDVSTFG